MSTSYIWGNLSKNLNDNQLISEAIAEALVAHNNDPVAHLGDGQALENHRHDDIIDHLAESIVNDKIKTTARRYVAIVNPQSETDYDTIASAVAYANSVGGGDIFIKRGTHYLPSVVEVASTVSFYGEGRGETVIESLNSYGSALSYYDTIYLQDDEGRLPSSLDGEQEFSYYDWIYGQDPPLAGMFLKIYGDSTQYNMIESFDYDTETVSLAEPLELSDEYTEVYVVAGFQLTNGSSEATLIFSDYTNLDRYYPGMSLVDIATGTSYKTLRRTGVDTFELELPYTGLTKKVPGWLQYTDGATINIEGISTRRDSYDVRMSGYPGNTTCRIQDCENFVGVSERGVYYQGCSFDCYSASNLQLYGNKSFSDCTFVARQNNARGLQVSGAGSVQNCAFKSNGYANHYWLSGNSQNCLISGNTFESQIATVVFNATGSHATYGLRIINNWFTFGSSGTYGLQCRNSIIMGNSFMMGTSDALQLVALSRACIFANNRCSKTPVNSGTNNLMVNNLVVA